MIARLRAVDEPTSPVGEYNRFMKRNNNLSRRLGQGGRESSSIPESTSRLDYGRVSGTASIAERPRIALKIKPAKKGSGRSDVSQRHDRYLARKQK
jgi:hypothetical protein